MRYILYFLISCCIFSSIQAYPFSLDDGQYDDCILLHQKETKNDQASNAITTACHKLFKENKFLSLREKKYYHCLLSYLLNVESNTGVQQIIAACDRRSRQ